MKITWKDILFFLIPGVLGYSIQVLCPLRKAGKDVKFRPPAVAFGIIWAILFILFGFDVPHTCTDANYPHSLCSSILSQL